MAKKRRRSNRRAARRAVARLGNPSRKHRKHSRRHRNSSKRWFNPGPNMTPALEGLAASMLAGGMGYVASKGIGIVADKYLPDSVPYRGLIGTGVAAVVAAFGAQKFLKGRPKMAAGVTVGAMIPVVEEIISMTPLGGYIGLYPADGSGAAPSALPAPGGVSASLAASLGASLGDHGDEDVSWAPADF